MASRLQSPLDSCFQTHWFPDDFEHDRLRIGDGGRIDPTEGLTRWSRQTHNIADDFHTFAVEWEADQISWFYDGVKYHIVTRADVGDRRWVFDQPFFFILNVAVGGQLGGMVSPETVFPAQLLVDYVRVYQSTRTIP